jgi:hypothetical protein
MHHKSMEGMIFELMSNFSWWTYWDLQDGISKKFGKFYGEPSISAGIRNLRKVDYRLKFGLPLEVEVIDKERIPEGKGYRFCLSHTVINHGKTRNIQNGL